MRAAMTALMAAAALVLAWDSPGYAQKKHGAAAQSREKGPAVKGEAPAAKERSIFLLDVIRTTLYNQSSILIQKEKIEEKKGSVDASKGAFDWILGARGEINRDVNSSYSYPFPGNHGTSTPLFGLTLRKAFSFGPSVEGGVTLKRQQYLRSFFDNYINFSPETWYQYQVKNYGRVDFKLNVPLLPLVGDKNYAANTRALKLQYKASLYDLQTKTSEAVYRTTVAYWEYLFAYGRLGILKDACERAEKIMEHTKALAKAGEVPFIEIENANGNLADKVNAFHEAEQALVEAKSSLAQAMGIPLGDLEGRYYPADPFPQFGKEKTGRLLAVSEQYYEMALHNRMELRSMTELIAAAEAYVVEARNQYLPDVNVQLGVGYDGSKRGDSAGDMVNSAKKNQPGLDMSARILFEYPLGNFEARGKYALTRSQVRQLKLQKLQVRNTIKTNVLASLYGLINALKELEKTEESVKIYMNAFEGEREKFKAGETTLLNIIDIQNRLDNVLINRLAVKKKTAAAIMRIRFETGTLAQFTSDDGAVRMKDLVTVPLEP